MMSHAAFVAWLIKTACGWLGWRPDEVLDADMSDVLLAIEGKAEMLRACFGGGEKPGAKPISSVEEFDRVFG